MTVEWEGEGEGPDWKTSYSLQVAATDGDREILAPLVIRHGYYTVSSSHLKGLSPEIYKAVQIYLVKALITSMSL